MRRRLLALTLGALASFAIISAASAASFSRGFADDVWFDPPSYHLSVPTWIAKTRSTGARFVQIEVDWIGVEPDAPTGSESRTNPSAPEFNFGYLDHEVNEFRGTGLQPVFLVTDAPEWAEGAGGTPAEYATGGYKPNAVAFGQLGAALARRYSGHYRPSRYHKNLPRVRYIQAWAEANMPEHLSPQWITSNGAAVNASVGIYRQMLNAFYAGVKSVVPSDQVLTTGLESYGDPPDRDQGRTHPVTFLEDLLCLRPNLRASACPDPAHFDVLASDPYDIGAPTVHALSSLDASAPDLGRLTRVIHAALARGTLLPRRAKPLWVTEFGYDSDPPNPTPGTISTTTQARWLEQSFYVFWHEGVSTELWYLIRDQTPPYNENYFSGVYFRDGDPKPSYTAYRFPFVVMQNGGGARIWGISPTSGTVSVQIQNGSTWSTMASFSGRIGRIYTRLMSLRCGHYRAVVGSQTSLVWIYEKAQRPSASQNAAIKL